MNSNSILVICMNPACPAPHLRCMDSRTLRTHPPDCSRHYFSADTIINNKWTDIQDYPSDPTGISVSRKLNQSKKDQHKKSNPYIVRMIQNFKQKICKSIDAFGQKFSTIIPSTSLQDLYIKTYSLQSVAKNIQQGNNPQFISKILNSNFSKLRHGQLQLINQKLNAIQNAFDNLLSGFRTQLKQIIDLVGVPKKNNNTQQVFRIEDGKLKPKIELGILKSKYIGSTKIQCADGKIIFPKQNNIGSFLPWIYSERAFSQGIHQLRITSLKYPSVLNCGFTVMQQHDIDTYPYHFFKSLFSKQGKGFIPAILHNDGILQSLQQNSYPKHEQIQYSINQVSQVILRLQLNSKPRAIIRNVQKTCFYVCKLTEGKKYRMGIYGSGWAINIKQLW